MSTAKQIFNEAFSKPRDPRRDALDRAIDAARAQRAAAQERPE